MRPVGTCLISIVFAICFSFSAAAQSSDTELDQVELVKKFLGSWVAQVGKDSVLHMKAVPFGEGIHFHGEWKTAGKAYYSSHAVIGFTRDKGTIILSGVWENGITVQEIGRFATEDLLATERFFPENPNHAVGLGEYDFSQPEQIIWRWHGRGAAVTWDPKWKSETTFHRVNE